MLKVTTTTTMTTGVTTMITTTTKTLADKGNSKENSSLKFAFLVNNALSPLNPESIFFVI